MLTFAIQYDGWRKRQKEEARLAKAARPGGMRALQEAFDG